MIEPSSLEAEILRLSAATLLASVVLAPAFELNFDIKKEVMLESLRAEDLGSLELTMSETTAIPSKR